MNKYQDCKIGVFQNLNGVAFFTFLVFSFSSFVYSQDVVVNLGGDGSGGSVIKSAGEPTNLAGQTLDEPLSNSSPHFSKRDIAAATDFVKSTIDVTKRVVEPYVKTYSPYYSSINGAINTVAAKTQAYYDNVKDTFYGYFSSGTQGAPIVGNSMDPAGDVAQMNSNDNDFFVGADMPIQDRSNGASASLRDRSSIPLGGRPGVSDLSGDSSSFNRPFNQNNLNRDVSFPKPSFDKFIPSQVALKPSLGSSSLLRNNDLSKLDNSRLLSKLDVSNRQTSQIAKKSLSGSINRSFTKISSPVESFGENVNHSFSKIANPVESFSGNADGLTKIAKIDTSKISTSEYFSKIHNVNLKAKLNADFEEMGKVSLATVSSSKLQPNSVLSKPSLSKSFKKIGTVTFSGNGVYGKNLGNSMAKPLGGAMNASFVKLAKVDMNNDMRGFEAISELKNNFAREGVVSIDAFLKPVKHTMFNDISMIRPEMISNSYLRNLSGNLSASFVGLAKMPNYVNVIGQKKFSGGFARLKVYDFNDLSYSPEIELSPVFLGATEFNRSDSMNFRVAEEILVFAGSKSQPVLNDTSFVPLPALSNVSLLSGPDYFVDTLPIAVSVLPIMAEVGSDSFLTGDREVLVFETVSPISIYENAMDFNVAMAVENLSKITVIR